jgi:phosphoserine aminotransferase
MTNDVYNFSAGPAVLPKSVLLKAQQDLVDWQGCGISVMEMSHRSETYQSIAQQAESDLRELLDISQDYAVLFLQGGATQQFSNIPMTLLPKAGVAEYWVNGSWSKKASAEAKRFGQVDSLELLNIDDSGLYSLVDPKDLSRPSEPVYTHYTTNETIEGLKFSSVPETTSPLIADMSSCILSEALDMNQFDLIYAGAQKNIGPAGICIVIVKKSLFEKMSFDALPKVFNYQVQYENGSMLNTPPTYAWYLSGLVFQWIKEQGGVATMQEQAKQRAELLYSCIDADDFYFNPIAKKDRSLMNIPFRIKDESLEKLFLEQAGQNHLINLKGHRSIGGMRASLYNAMPMQGVQTLVDFMQDFRQQQG